MARAIAVLKCRLIQKGVFSLIWRTGEGSYALPRLNLAPSKDHEPERSTPLQLGYSVSSRIAMWRRVFGRNHPRPLVLRASSRRNIRMRRASFRLEI